MLCSSCTAHFGFSRPDIIEACQTSKQLALDFGTQNGFQESHLAVLENDLIRYQQQLEAQAQAQAQEQNVSPRPFGKAHKFNHLFPTCDVISVWRSEHPRSWKDLCQSAAKGECHLCETLVAMIRYAGKGVGIEDETPQVTSVWLVEPGSCLPYWLRFYFVEGDGPTLCCHFHVNVNEQNKDHGLSPLRMPCGMSTAAETCTEFLFQTLSNCLLNHSSCTPGQVYPWIPERLLDVSQTLHNPNSIVLVERSHLEKSEAQQTVRYCTLSHIWGKSKPATLTQNTYAELKKGIKVDHLPRCFQDAIKITRSMGLQYLWIDALCIMQDSSTDWAEQAAVMDKIYRGGICNLAACDINDSHDSIFSQRYPKTGSAIIHRQIYTDSSTVFTIAPDWPRLTWDASKLYRRAWVMQERWLSTRIIHFSQFPIWECNSSLITEGFPPRNKIQDSDEFPGFPLSQRGWLFSRENKMGIIERWWKIVDRYTRCSLTYRSDTLVAISGMARCMSKLTNEPYYGGIWGGQYLILSLLWNRMSTTVTLPSQQYIAPSWSWASVDGHILTYEYRCIAQTLADLISIHVTPKTNDLFGELSAGELVLRGHLFTISNPRVCRDALKGCWLDHRETMNIDTAIYFIPLAELKPQIQCPRKEFAGLFIQPAESLSGKRTFQRVGCRQFSRDYGPQFLDEGQWGRLEILGSLEEEGEFVLLV